MRWEWEELRGKQEVEGRIILTAVAAASSERIPAKDLSKSTSALNKLAKAFFFKGAETSRISAADSSFFFFPSIRFNHIIFAVL